MKSLRLLSAVPSEPDNVRIGFAKSAPGSFLDEYRRSRPLLRTIDELAEDYMSRIPATLDEIEELSSRWPFVLIRESKISDLSDALSDGDIIALLGHHVPSEISDAGKIELSDGLLDYNELSIIAPTRPYSLVHLGVCRSAPFINAFKARTSSIKVIASELDVDPYFFLRLVQKTAVLMFESGEDYATAMARIRFALLRLT